MGQRACVSNSLEHQAPCGCEDDFHHSARLPWGLSVMIPAEAPCILCMTTEASFSSSALKTSPHDHSSTENNVEIRVLSPSIYLSGLHIFQYCMRQWQLSFSRQSLRVTGMCFMKDREHLCSSLSPALVLAIAQKCALSTHLRSVRLCYKICLAPCPKWSFSLSLPLLDSLFLSCCQTKACLSSQSIDLKFSLSLLWFSLSM